MDETSKLLLQVSRAKTEALERALERNWITQMILAGIGVALVFDVGDLPKVFHRDRNPLTVRMMQQLQAGVSMRKHEGSLEARPRGRRTRGSSKSSVSRAVVRRTRQRLQEHLTRRLEGLEVAWSWGSRATDTRSPWDWRIGRSLTS